MKLHNGDRLIKTALLEQIAIRALDVVSQNLAVRSVRVLLPCEYAEAAHGRDWLTIGSGQIWSVSMSSSVFLPPGAPLARSRVALGVAQAVAAGTPEETFQDADTIMATGSRPPAEWSCVEIATSFDSVLCAGMFSPVLLSQKLRSLASSCTSRVRIRLVGYGEQVREPIRGVALRLSELSLLIPDLEIGVRLCMEEKLMVELDDATQREHKGGSIPVRLDLGSLDLSLQEIAALREGHRLELDAQLPTTCFLRIGQVVIAAATLEYSEEGLVVRVQKTVDMNATSSAGLSI